MKTVAKTLPNTKSTRLYIMLKGKIEDGSFAAGSQLPSCRRLAAEFDVSYVTASQALKSLVGEGLVRNFRGKGIFVPDAAQLPVCREVKLICTGLNSPLSAEFLREGMAIFQAAGWNARQMLVNGPEQVIAELADYDSFLVLFGFGFECYRRIIAEVERLRAQRRLVLIGERGDRHGIASVIADEPQQIRLSMDFLKRAGRGRVGLLCANLGNSVEQERVAAWRNFYRNSVDGVPEWQKYFFHMGITDSDGDDIAFTVKYMKRVHAEGRLADIDALITPDASLSACIVGFMKDYGIRVPEDIALISIGDAEYLSFVRPRISVVDPDIHAHLQAALEYLEERLHGGHTLPLLHLCEPCLKIRESIPELQPY